MAVKRLHADSPDEMEQRFAREARLGASLNHPNLVAIYDTATDDEGVLIVMEYVEGESLSQALKRGPLEPRRVGRMASELGDALDHAHSHGVVHRDVKPGTSCCATTAPTKLADLGIATAADQTRITRSGIVLGTAAYMAPEQLDGAEAGPAGGRVRAAAVCFEALAGRRARTGRTPMEIAGAIATQPPPDLRDHLQEAPAAAPTSSGAVSPGPAGAAGVGRRARLGAPAPLERPAEPTVATRPIRSAPGPAAAGRRREPPRAPGRGWRSRWPARSWRVAAATVALLAAGGGGDDGGSAARRRRHERARRPSPGRAAKRPAIRRRRPSRPRGARGPVRGERPGPERPGLRAHAGGPLEEAVPMLQQAVATWPEDSRDIEYAYALFNLGKSLTEPATRRRRSPTWRSGSPSTTSGRPSRRS